MKKKKPKPKEKTDALDHVAEYLKAQGWKVLVIGPARVEQQAFWPQFKFQLVVEFTGGKKEVQEKIEHQKRHALLHQHLDELSADFFAQTNKLPSRTSIMELMEWSHKQTLSPTEGKL